MSVKGSSRSTEESNDCGTTGKASGSPDLEVAGKISGGSSSSSLVYIVFKKRFDAVVFRSVGSKA